MSEPLDLETLTDVVAERLSWEGGEMTRWSETAHEDHNRWSWPRGAHAAVMREEYLRMARGAVDAVLIALDGSGAPARGEVDPESTDGAEGAESLSPLASVMREIFDRLDALEGGKR